MNAHTHKGRSTEGVQLQASALAAAMCLLIAGLAALACPSIAFSADPTGGVQGVVVRAGDGLPLATVEVTLAPGGLKATTNSFGRFSFSDVAPGRYVLKARRAGYLPTAADGVEVHAGEVTDLELELRSISFTEEIVVAPSQYSLYRDEPVARFSTSREELRRVPHFADDTFRALERLPGATSEDVSARINIRGGEVNETLVLIDGLEIYDGFHLQDLGAVFSIIDSEALGGLDAMTGGFSARYGNRMSGVIDMTSASPEDTSNALIVGFTQFGVLSEGTFDGGRGQWLVSARRTYLDRVIEMVDPDSGFKPIFYDLLASLRFSLGDHSVLSANVLGSDDELVYEETDGSGEVSEEYLEATSRSGYVWANLKTVYGPRSFSETVLSHGKVRRQREGWIEYFVAAGEVDETRDYEVTGLRQDWNFDVSPRHSLRWGFDLRHASAEYDYSSWSIVRDPLFVGDQPAVTEREVALTPSGNLISLYAADRVRIAEPLLVELGLRWDRQSYTDDDQLSPRLNLAYTIGRRSVVRAAWGAYSQPQYLNELQVEDGVTDFAPAQRAEHRTLGFETNWGTAWNLRLEAYQKRLTDVRPRFENQLNPIELFPEIEPDRILVAPERAETAGLELMVKHRGDGPWSWWASYAFSKAEDLIDGEWVPRAWDQPHAVNFAVNFAPGERWNFNLAGIYHTGWPTTAIHAELVQDSGGIPGVDLSLGPRNEERFDDYVRIDLRASRTFRVGDGSLLLFVEVMNLLDRENLGRIDSLDLWLDHNGDLQVSENREYGIPIIPTFGLRWTF